MSVIMIMILMMVLFQLGSYVLFKILCLSRTIII